MNQIERNVHVPSGRLLLTQFTCEGCFQVIGCLEEGMFEFMAVIVGAGAAAYLLNLIAPGEPFNPNPSSTPVGREDVTEWAEMIRQLTVPFYEEARPFMGLARADGFVEGLNEATIHSRATLAATIDRYD